MALGSFSLTALRSLLSKPATTAFPAEPYAPAEGARGSLRFSAETCTYCSLCALRCPTGAIQVDRVRKAWVLDRFQCIVCAACVDACQKGALATDPMFAPPVARREPELHPVAEEAEACAHPEEGGSGQE